MKKETIIDVTINDKEDYINKFNENKLSKDFISYILEECKGESLNNLIVFKIRLNYNATLEEQNKLVNMIKSSCEVDVKENQFHLSQSLVRKILLFLLGILFLIISYFDIIHNNFILSEISLIVGWVAIWEVVYAHIFEDSKMRIKIKRLKQLSKSKIIFE